MFDLITTLKEVGLSLEEIKNYMDERDADAFMELLKEQDKLLKQKIEVLTRRRRLLRNTLKMTKEAFDVQENTISIEDAGEEYFIISDRPKNNSEKELFAVVSRLWDYCTKHNAYDDFVTGEIIPYENIVNGSFATGWFSSRVDKKAKSRYLHVELHELGYEPNGSIYQNDITNYLSERYADDYLMKIEVSVKRHDENGCK